MQLATRVISAVIGLTASLAHAASSETYPTRPIRTIATEAGGSGDFVARLIAQGLTNRLGQQVIVDNRTPGVISGQILAHARPDGYTLLLGGSSVWLLPFLQPNLPYDPAHFLPITMTQVSPNVVVVHPSVSAKSISELITLARTYPGKINYASGATGSSAHLAAELFKSMANIDIVKISYKGVGPAINDMITGQVQLMFPAVASGMPHVKSGRLRALAVTSAAPSVLLPGLPTVAQSGLPGYEATNMNAMFAPSKTPAAIIQRLNQETVAVLRQPDVKEKLLSVGVEPAGSSTNEAILSIRSEVNRMGKVIKDSAIRNE